MSDAENTLEPIKDVSKKSVNWNIVLAAIPILSSIFYALIQFIQYWVEISYLSFWNIPREFMHSNDGTFVYNFITIIAVVIIALLIGYIIYQLYKKIEFTSKHKICIYLKQTLLIISVFAFVFLGIGTVLCLYLIKKVDVGTYSNVLHALIHDINIMILIFVLSIIFTITLFLFGFIISPRMAKISKDTFTDDEKKKDKPKKCRFRKKKNKENSYRNPVFMKLIGILLIITLVLGYGVYIYIVLLQQYKSTTDFEVINREYVVLYKNSENLIIKQCLINDNIIYIDNDAYQLIDAKDTKIQTITFKKNGEESVFKRLTSKEFQNLINETNPNEDTPS